MDNPYQAPTTNVDNGIVEPRTKKGWKILAWVAVAVQLLSTVVMFAFAAELFGPGMEEYGYEFSSWDYLASLIIYPMMAAGLFGFAYDKRLLNANVWKLILVVGFALDIYSYSEQGWSFGDDISILAYAWYLTVFYWGVFVLLLVYSLFQYYALYQYGFKSPEIWLGKDDKQT